MNEKKEIKKIVNNIDNTKLKENKYIDKVIYTFELRNKMMETKNIIKYGLRSLISSIGLNKLYESVTIDIITILKNKNH